MSRDSDFRDQFRWLSGKWESRSGDTVKVEHWKWDKHRYVGMGYEMRGEDTVFKESFFLEQHGKHSSYVAVIPGQQPILFSGRQREGKWLFINAEHDFPSRLVYDPHNDSAIRISIVAHEDTMHPWSYELTRVK